MQIHAFIHKETRWKLDTHSIQCIFLGYSEESKAYKLMTTSGEQVLIVRDIIFYETHKKSTHNFIQQNDDIEKDPYLMQIFLNPT
jgi:hypothetical protein